MIMTVLLVCIVVVTIKAIMSKPMSFIDCERNVAWCTRDLNQRMDKHWHKGLKRDVVYE